MSQKPKTAITPTRDEDYAEWYQQVIKEADLAENSAVRGCMVIKPWGYAIWELMRDVLDKRFKETGHKNAYFPLFIPKSYLEKEAEHVDGFAKECAVVTHSRLEADEGGKLVPTGELEEPLIVRPTSEMIIGESFSRWIQSYRDLPMLINQWANVVRWEMRTRLFLRSAEFLWQEGHTAHATAQEAEAETRLMLDIYAEFAEGAMAMPVIKGRKTEFEKFPGAEATYSIEPMMQDGRALQAGTTHYMGQNFAKALGIKFQSEQGREAHAWTTSWGVSTRMIGGLIMTHSDDDGLVLPPRLAPAQIVILPVIPKPEMREEVMSYCQTLKAELEAQHYAGLPVRVEIDDRDIRGGEKVWGWIKKGVPIRLEVGPRDVANDAVFVGRRDKAPKDKGGQPRAKFVAQVSATLSEIQQNLYDRAKARRDSQMAQAKSEADVFAFLEKGNGFITAYYAESEEVEEKLGEYKAKVLNLPLDGDAGPCVFTGDPGKLALIGRSY